MNRPTPTDVAEMAELLTGRPAAANATSGEAVPEERASVGRCAVSTGSPAVPSAGVFWVAAVLEDQAEKRRDAAENGWIGCSPGDVSCARNTMQAFAYCAEVLRRHAAAMNERQPQENK